MSGRAAAVLGLLAVGTVGCRSREEKQPTPPAAALPSPILGSVVTEDHTPAHARPAGVAIDGDDLVRRTESNLRGAGVFARAPVGDAGGAPLASRQQPVAEVTLGFSIEAVETPENKEKGLARALVKLRVAVRPRSAVEPYWLEDVEAAGEVPYALRFPDGGVTDRDRLFETLLHRMINDLLTEYLARVRLPRGRDADILAALAAQSAEVRGEAIRIAGERKLPAATPVLLRLLEDDDERVRDAALGALLNLGERRAVAVLGKTRSMRDRREMGKILDAISLLGGEEAESYLHFVADAHEDEEVKAQAKTALERLLRRKPASPP